MALLSIGFSSRRICTSPYLCFLLLQFHMFCCYSPSLFLLCCRPICISAIVLWWHLYSLRMFASFVGMLLCIVVHVRLFPICIHDTCTSLADRRGRHSKQVESHIYHEEPRINLTERNGSVSSSRSIGSLKHQMSDVSITSGGRLSVSMY